MNLIELLVVLATMNSAVPLTGVRDSQVVWESLVRCQCMTEEPFKAKFSARNNTRAESSVAHVCGVLKGFDLNQLKQGHRKALVVYGGCSAQKQTDCQLEGTQQ